MSVVLILNPVAQSITDNIESLDIADFKATEYILERMAHLSRMPATTNEGIYLKLECLTQTGVIDMHFNDIDILRHYEKAWANNDLEFIKLHTENMIRNLNLVKNDNGGEWFLLLSSIKEDINKYLATKAKRDN